VANHEGKETSVPMRLHVVLLALAGRIDDGALGHARQLSASARADEAAELVAGTLIAGEIPLRSSERQEFGEVLAASGGDVSLLEKLTVGEQDVEPAHQFGADNQPDAGVAAAIEPIKAALPDLRAVHAVWRNTAAGRVPGAVPQRVVLIEVGAKGSPPATAQRVAIALRDAGVPAVVEVASPAVDWPSYQQRALAAAVPVVTAEAAGSAPVRELRRPQQEPEPAAAGFSAPPEQPAFAAHQPTESTTTEPRRTNGHHRADRQPGESFWPQLEPTAKQQTAEHAREDSQAEPPDQGASRVVNFPESAVESTTELSDADVQKLQDALRRAEAAERAPQQESVQMPASDAEAQLSERDRELLRELHAELAKREREQAEQVKLNGWHRPS